MPNPSTAKSSIVKPAICPRCHNNMQLLIQSENHGQNTTITYIYLCPVCRYRIATESVELKRDTDKILISRKIARTTFS